MAAPHRLRATRAALLSAALVCVLSACANQPKVGVAMGCATSNMKAGDKVKANGVDATVMRIVGPSDRCTVDRPIEAEFQYD